MEVQLDQNPFKTLIIATKDTIKVYIYYKTENKSTYKFFYFADQGMGSIDVDLGKIDIRDTEKFIANEGIPSLMDFTYIDGMPSTEKFRLEFLNSLASKLVSKLKIPEVLPIESVLPIGNEYKAKFEVADEINKRLIEAMRDKVVA
jgi:hypothetical protein